MTPDKQPAVETLEQIAERVVDENLDTYHYAFTRQALITATLSALRNENIARRLLMKFKKAVEP